MSCRSYLAAPVVSAVALFLSWSACAGAPPLKVTKKAGVVTVDVQTLGEYQTTVTRIKLTDRSENQVVWEVLASSGTPQIHTLTLSAGENAATISDARPGEYRVVKPEGRSTFSLVPGRDYLIELWGENVNGTPASAVLSVDDGHRTGT